MWQESAYQALNAEQNTDLATMNPVCFSSLVVHLHCSVFRRGSDFPCDSIQRILQLF
jgi:hypothetical protein